MADVAPSETAWAFLTVYPGPPDEMVLEYMTDYLDTLADERWGAGRWSRVSVEAGPWEGSASQLERQEWQIRHDEDPEIRDPDFSFPEGTVIWRALGKYHPVAADGG